MITGESFEQQDYQISMMNHLPPVKCKKLENFIRHNTVLFIQEVVVRKLSLDKTGVVWSFQVPEGIEDLTCHMFDLSLGCTIIDYQCGTTVYDLKVDRSIWADEITVVDSPDGKTNITSELIDAMGDRYALV